MLREKYILLKQKETKVNNIRQFLPFISDTQTYTRLWSLMVQLPSGYLIFTVCRAFITKETCHLHRHSTKKCPKGLRKSNSTTLHSWLLLKIPRHVNGFWFSYRIKNKINWPRNPWQTLLRKSCTEDPSCSALLSLLARRPWMANCDGKQNSQ